MSYKQMNILFMFILVLIYVSNLTIKAMNCSDDKLYPVAKWKKLPQVPKFVLFLTNHLVGSFLRCVLIRPDYFWNILHLRMRCEKLLWLTKYSNQFCCIKITNKSHRSLSLIWGFHLICWIAKVKSSLKVYQPLN